MGQLCEGRQQTTRERRGSSVVASHEQITEGPEARVSGLVVSGKAIPEGIPER